jgi:hypothetical protein
MMTKNWIFSILAAALLAESSFGQRQKAPQPTIINGVKVDLAKFQQLFAGVRAELRSSAVKVPLSVRYGQYADAMAELEKLSTHPALSAPQKQVAAEVLQQLKQALNQTQAQRGP